MTLRSAGELTIIRQMYIYIYKLHQPSTLQQNYSQSLNRPKLRPDYLGGQEPSVLLYRSNTIQKTFHV
jgi:hypothetical protein